VAALTVEEIEAARAATPGCGEVIHLDHAGSSLPPHTVLDAQIGHLQTEAAIGGYEAAAAVIDERDAVYDSIGVLIGARPHEIARMEHATAAWNAAFWSVPMNPDTPSSCTTTSTGRTSWRSSPRRNDGGS